MKKREEPERRTSLRLPESLAKQIDEYNKETGMSFTEFVKRACQEKLSRETNSVNSYVTRAEFEELQNRIMSMEKNSQRFSSAYDSGRAYCVAEPKITKRQ